MSNEVGDCFKFVFFCESRNMVAFKMERLARKDPGVAPLPDNHIN